jgi:CTP synthase (UTP-ammonia lyase)
MPKQLPEQKDIEDLGGTLRLGLYPCTIKEGTLAHSIYNENNILNLQYLFVQVISQ